MTKDEALDLALEALEYTTTMSKFLLGEDANIGPMLKADQAITAIKQARSAPVQEPVACKTLCELCVKRGYNFCANAAKTTPIITTPPAQPAPVQEPVNQRAYEMALRQWESWKQYALELQEKLVKYEGGAPMVLNTTAAQRQWVGLTDEEMDELVNRFARYELVRATENLLRSKSA